MTRIILPIIMLITAVTLLLLQVRPGYERVAELRAEEKRYQDAVDTSKELQRVRDELNTKYRSFALTDIDRLLAVLPDYADNVRLALNLDTIARAHNVKLSEVEASAEDTGSTSSDAGEETAKRELSLGSSTVEFSIEGTYPNLISFLEDVEKSLQLVDLVSLEFKNEEGALTSYQATIRTYWLN